MISVYVAKRTFADAVCEVRRRRRNVWSVGGCVRVCLQHYLCLESGLDGVQMLPVAVVMREQTGLVGLQVVLGRCFVR